MDTTLFFALQAENTYLLTLDGDIDFKAESVTLLVDRMKKNKKVGAACGRIHPIGTGNVLQYSLFQCFTHYTHLSYYFMLL